MREYAIKLAKKAEKVIEESGNADENRTTLASKIFIENDKSGQLKQELLGIMDSYRDPELRAIAQAFASKAGKDQRFLVQ